MELQPDSTIAVQGYTAHLGYVGRQIERVKIAERNYRLNPYSVRTIELLIRTYVNEMRFEDTKVLEERAWELGGTWAPRTEHSRGFFECADNPKCHLERLTPESARYRDQYQALFSAVDSNDQSLIMTAAKGLVDDSHGEELNYLITFTCAFDELTPVFFKLREWNEPYRVHWYWPNTWIPVCGNLWEDPRFRDLLEEVGLVEYYRSKGWPDACRPEGKGFVCSEAIWREKRRAAGLDVPVSGRKAMP